MVQVRKTSVTLLVAVMLAMSFAVGCSVKMLGNPDADFVKQVYAFNGEVMKFMVGLEKKLIECGIEKTSDVSGKECPSASYASNRKFYLETVPLGIAEMRLRAMANPPNDVTLSHIDMLEEMLGDFQKQHMKGELTPRYVEKKRRVISQVFAQILLMEKAKEIAQPSKDKQ